MAKNSSKRELRLNPKSGFTLVELAIVLVIVGLLVGGVLQGQELIQQAKIKSQISQIDEYVTAANAFRAKFGKLPGDLNRASNFGFGNTNGNGDDRITNSCFINSEWWNNGGINNYSNESVNFIYHLQQANLIKTSGLVGSTVSLGTGWILINSNIDTKLAKSSFSDKIYILPTSFYRLEWCNYVGAVSWGANTASSNYANLRTGGSGFALAWLQSNDYVNAQISGDFLRDLDTKIDDGLPLTGNIGIGVEGHVVISAATVGYLASNVYNTTSLYTPIFLNQY